MLNYKAQVSILLYACLSVCEMRTEAGVRRLPDRLTQNNAGTRCTSTRLKKLLFSFLNVYMFLKTRSSARGMQVGNEMQDNKRASKGVEQSFNFEPLEREAQSELVYRGREDEDYCTSSRFGDG